MRRRGTSPWYAVRDQGGVEAITQKGAQFASQIGLGGQAQPAQERPMSADVAQVGPVAAAPAPQPAAPVYATDLGTTARRFGNFLAPSLVDAPTPLPPQEVQQQMDEQRRMQSDLSRANDAMRAFSAMSSYGQQMGAQQRPSLLQPSVVRGQFRPITMGRGLL